MKSNTAAPAKPHKSLREWAKSMRGQQIIVTLVFLLVPLLLLFTFTYLPFLKMVQFSFFKMKYIGKREFVGLKNYIDVFTRDDCFSALKLSLYYMVGSVVQMALALLFATILSFKVKGSKFFRGALYFPCLICGISVGFIFKFFFTHGFVLDSLLGFLGIPLESCPYWLKDESINNIVLVACSVWKYVGQNIVMFIGAIASVDSTLYEAADIDGANAWHKFKDIILPSIRTIVVLNLIISVSGALSAFEMPYVVTGGAFGTSTYNEYYMANLYLQDKTKYQVVSTSLYVFTGPMGSQYNYICAGVLITIIPALIIFLLCQDQIYSGMAAGAVKG